MSLYLEKQYVSRISSRLQRFKQKSEFLWNMRCPFCGDSQKSKIKARGYIYKGKHGLAFTCHNCSEGMSFSAFLKKVDYTLYREFQMDVFKDKNPKKEENFDAFKCRPVFDKSKKINLPSIESLPDSHSAKKYLINRKIPRDRMSDLFYADKFDEFVKEIHPTYDGSVPTDPRIVIPFRDRDGLLLGFQGRAIGDSDIRYITIKLDESFLKVYGLDRVDFGKPILVVEGPIDSMFLDNGIAVMDSALYKAVVQVGEHDYVFVSDNERRNKDVNRNLGKMIEMGVKVVIWPRDIPEKDVNDMILAGRDVNAIIHTNTFSGLRAKLEFENWKI